MHPATGKALALCNRTWAVETAKYCTAQIDSLGFCCIQMIKVVLPEAIADMMAK